MIGIMMSLSQSSSTGEESVFLKLSTVVCPLIL